ncbi:MAG: primosomal protein N' [Coriobacteriales bacterium]|nr:primosomal protein N' [Coriobacteriales bacterium]
MAYASVVPDISTRALDGSFAYGVPTELEQTVEVGTTVLVTLHHRPTVGYVVGLSEEPPADLVGKRLLPIEQVLAPSAFDECGAELASWIAREYACNLPDALRLFLAPGQKVRVRRQSEDAPWELQDQSARQVDDRWVVLTNAGRDFKPRANATRQNMLLQILRQGPVRVAELNAMLTGMSSAIRSLEARGAVEVQTRRLVRGDEQTTLSSTHAAKPARHTEGQERALAAIEAACKAGKGDVVLVDGVTGSGKTEVYLSAIERVLDQGKGAIVLVPEISLTPQTVGRFRARFGEAVSVLHSRLSTGERYDQWDLVRKGIARVVVGARSALFAPLVNPGLIVIDEEHEGSYKQDGTPRYHAREVAAELARLRGCPLVLGSATPSLESLGRCRDGAWRGASWTRVEMPERPASATLPAVEVVDMAAQFRDGGRSIFSAPLANGLREVARRRQKAVLLLNRRGFASFLMCRECGCVPECPHCSTSLTYHERTQTLACHTCGRSWPIRAFPDPSTQCPNCGSRYLAALGVGTQRVEDELLMLLSAEDTGPVEVIRMDADTTRTKGAHQKLLEKFDAAECAVLVGTQMIAKGLDFPEVTLVGVINADTTLKLPDFRAAERTYALLEQVAGRAGRGEVPGKVVIQSYWATHPAIQAAAHHDRSLFLDSELAQRKEAGYPPYARFTNVLVWGCNAADVNRVSESIAQKLRDALSSQGGWELLGPADCIKARVKDRTRRHVVLKTPVDSQVGELVGSCVRAVDVPQGINIAIDVDAHDMM